MSNCKETSSNNKHTTIVSGAKEKPGCAYSMYMMTPRLHMSQELSYFSGPSTSGATRRKHVLQQFLRFVNRPVAVASGV